MGRVHFDVDLLRGGALVVDDEVVDVVVVDLGAVVDGRVRNVAAHVVDDVRHHLSILLLPLRRAIVENYLPSLAG